MNTTTHTIETPLVTLDPTDDLLGAAFQAVQQCPKRREPAADEPYAPNPERSVVTPACDQIDVDITGALRLMFKQDGQRFEGQHVTAERPVLVVEGGKVLVRYQVRGSE